ncbi:hypothetical protein M5K25_018783 [Dendrobium thyrsiflorum]|uniref:SWIM-type domain-containing protein n=1 Tax=Dendrobium thyrsiflorum TaxID=117978 RepID=A0ABD0UK31_DENTH
MAHSTFCLSKNTKVIMASQDYSDLPDEWEELLLWIKLAKFITKRGGLPIAVAFNSKSLLRDLLFSLSPSRALAPAQLYHASVSQQVTDRHTRLSEERELRHGFARVRGDWRNEGGDKPFFLLEVADAKKVNPQAFQALDSGDGEGRGERKGLRDGKFFNPTPDARLRPEASHSSRKLRLCKKVKKRLMKLTAVMPIITDLVFARTIIGVGGMSIDFISIDSSKFLVNYSEIKDHSNPWVVHFDAIECTIQCTCKKFETMGLLCSHGLGKGTDGSSGFIFRNHISRFAYQISTRAQGNEMAEQYMLVVMKDMDKNIDLLVEGKMKNNKFQAKSQGRAIPVSTYKDPQKCRPKGISNARLKAY